MRIGQISSMVALLAAIGSAAAQPPAPSARPSGTNGTPANGAASMTTTDTGTFSEWVDSGPADSAGILGVDPNQLYNRWYGKAEYLLWKIRNSELPQLQLTVPFSASNLDQLQPNITVPGGDVDHAARTGGRITLGYWCDLDHYFGVEASYFQLENRQDPFFQNQLQNTPLNVVIQQNVQEVVQNGGVTTTTLNQIPLTVTLPALLTVTANGRVGPTDFFGTEISGRSTRAYFGPAVFDLLGGFRFINLDENLALSQTVSIQTANPTTVTTNGLAFVNNNGIFNTTVVGNNVVPVGAPITIPQPINGLSTLATSTSNNQITTYNRFYGANLGASFECWCSSRIFFNGYGKIAVGAMTQQATLVNFTTTSALGAAPITTAGGTFSPLLGTLSHSRTRYAFVPEFNLNVGIQLTTRCRATLGYNLMYLTSVVRPGNQIIFGDSNTALTISGTSQPGGVAISQPTFRYQDTDFYAQGLVGGLEFRY